MPAGEIVGEINRAVARGHKEVVLTGTQLGSYGFDLPDITLAGLLKRILLETEVPRLRVSSLQPQDLGPALVGLWADDRLCPHFHLPLQSGSDAVLKRMRRRYTSRQYVHAVEMVRRLVPDVSITADVIAGFPGETEEEFGETYSLCEQIGFATMHVFPYSARPGTSAAHSGAQVGSDVRSRRAQALLKVAEVQAIEFRRRFLGRVRPVLWEGESAVEGTALWSGLTDNYIKVIGRSRRPLANQVTPARLSEQREGLVYAEVL